MACHNVSFKHCYRLSLKYSSQTLVLNTVFLASGTILEGVELLGEGGLVAGHHS